MSKDKEVEGFSFTEVFQNSNHCYRETDVHRYFEGRLSAEDERSFEQHLASCDDCAGKLAALQTVEQAAENTVLDSDQANRIFSKNRTRLQAALDVKYPVGMSTAPSFFGAFRLPPYANALLMLLVAVLVYPAYRSFVLDSQLERTQGELAAEKSKTPPLNLNSKELQGLKEENRRLTEPSLSGSAVYSARPERDADQKMITVRLTDRDPNFNLVFALPPADFESYAVDIAQGSSTVWQKQIPSEATGGLISVYLQASSIKPGNYVLRIKGLKGGQSNDVAEYKLKVTD